LYLLPAEVIDMSMLNGTGFHVPRYPRLTEVVLYGMLAAALIGEVLRHSTPLTMAEAVAVLAGALCGILAACGASPLTAFLNRWARAGAVPEQISYGLTNVSAFVRKGRDRSWGSHDATDDSRRAA
jgi:hypothetical protein